MSFLVLAAADLDHALSEVEIPPSETANLDAPAGRVHRDHSRAVCSHPFIPARRRFEQAHFIFNRKRPAHDSMVFWQWGDIVGELVPTFGPQYAAIHSSLLAAVSNRRTLSSTGSARPTTA